jgi:hypothetical protein
LDSISFVVGARFFAVNLSRFDCLNEDDEEDEEEEDEDDEEDDEGVDEDEDDSDMMRSH